MDGVSVEIDEIGLGESHTTGIRAAEGTRKIITDHAPAFGARRINCGVASGLNGEIFPAHHQVGNRNVVRVSVTTPKTLDTVRPATKGVSGLADLGRFAWITDYGNRVAERTRASGEIVPGKPDGTLRIGGNFQDALASVDGIAWQHDVDGMLDFCPAAARKRAGIRILASHRNAVDSSVCANGEGHGIARNAIYCKGEVLLPSRHGSRNLECNLGIVPDLVIDRWCGANVNR